MGRRLGGATRLFVAGRSTRRSARRFIRASAIPICAGGCCIHLGAHARVQIHQGLQCTLLLPDADAIDRASDPGGNRSARLCRFRASVSVDAPETPVGGNKRCHDRFLQEVVPIALKGLWRLLMYVSNGC